MAIQFIKEGTGYTVWNTKSFKCVDIIAFEDYFMGNYRTKYRVDENGSTKSTSLPLTEAKKIARKLVK